MAVGGGDGQIREGSIAESSHETPVAPTGVWSRRCMAVHGTRLGDRTPYQGGKGFKDNSPVCCTLEQIEGCACRNLPFPGQKQVVIPTGASLFTSGLFVFLP